MTQNQGAAHAQSHNVHPSQSSQMMPASSASHSGQQNTYGGSIISAAQLSLPHGNKGTGVPHSGPRQATSSYTGVVHTAHSAHSNVVSFDSGSTSFNNISHTQSNNQINPSSQMSRGQARIGGSGGAPLSAQVSSPPSNQVVNQSQNNQSSQNFATNTSSNNRNVQSNDQQNNPFFVGSSPNTDLRDISGPGAVGAPPSSSQGIQMRSAISPPAQSQSNRASGQPNAHTGEMHPSNQHQNISPGSTSTGQGQAIGCGRSLPPAHSSSTMEHQQQSINTIPSSLFSTGGGAGSGQEAVTNLPQAPAALGAHQNQYHGSVGGGSGDLQEGSAGGIGQSQMMGSASQATQQMEEQQFQSQYQTVSYLHL